MQMKCEENSKKIAQLYNVHLLQFIQIAVSSVLLFVYLNNFT